MVINVVNLARRRERREAVTKELEAQGCSYVFWQGKEGPDTKKNIHAAFKPIIEFHKKIGAEMVCVAEDDLKFTAATSWQYFLDNIPKDFDVYCSSYYSGTHDENFIVKGFRGNTLLIIHSRFFDRFLALSDKDHLDGAIARSGAKVIVSPKFCAIQTPGYSDQRRRMADDSKRLIGKEIFHG